MPNQPFVRLAAEESRVLASAESKRGNLLQAMRVIRGSVSPIAAGPEETHVGAPVKKAHSRFTERETLLVGIAAPSSSVSAASVQDIFVSVFATSIGSGYRQVSPARAA